ncbi:signal recognition particle-docking protein FtsY [Neptuniibacter sp. 1_MG-2023]|jgi:fused signal recognition particle receptor|uniref:signal recognition particle-docking protein FtsY n=1 Tax=Neptuniibacter sp. 1_MG-2023 TaxID=3062662 RepID=UPI0026E4299B|nr:signal recognition particle-docking protein FtsY [Neptuniibacter sp. 1_MG-2023]MDO6594323.1 signal recognition particle-docking protein FtsY [Neptuniibacter sp. 1_MG-2023]
MFKKLKSMFGGSSAEETVEHSEVENNSVEKVEESQQPIAELKEDQAEQPAVAKAIDEQDPVATENVEPEIETVEPETVPETIAAEVFEETPTLSEEPAEKEEIVDAIIDEIPELEEAEVDLKSEDQVEEKKGFFARIKKGLSKTKASLTEQLGNIFLGAKEIDDDLLEEIETLLLMADVGVEATSDIIGRLTEKVARKQLGDPQALQAALKEELSTLLHQSEQPLQIDCSQKPYVILMVGVNGVGKTTTIGKLAKKFQSEGKSVMLAAGDTFRAAAVEQLQVWGERNKVPVVAQHTGADSASVIYDAVQSAQAKNIDILIADTAGRLQNKDNLMQELEKVVRVTQKLSPEAPHEVMLVLDAGTGQNALSQAKIFKESVGVTGISLTKLDGTAKGGVIFAIAKQMDLPIRFIGVGEQIDDLRPFNSQEFVDALFD